MVPLHSVSFALDEIHQRRSKTMTSIAVEAIEGMIVSGHLEAGNRINESLLASQLGISRGPIREACRSLERVGLLISKTNQGMYVREMSENEARDLYELRGAIAGLIGRLIVERGSQDDEKRLQQLVDLMQKAADTQNAKDYYRLNLEFHDTLVKVARNPALAEAYNRIVSQLHLLRKRGLVQEGSLHVSNREHRQIVQAMVARDAQAASLAMEQHVGNGLARMLANT